MQTNYNTARAVNASGLPLFLWADAHAVDHVPLQTLSPAARRIARRLGVAPRRASLIAQLAGFPSEVFYV